jgi:hypothetical protein
MTSLDIVGGVYHEKCLANEWDQIFGSAGRAAAALQNHVLEVNLWTYMTPAVADIFMGYSATYKFVLCNLAAPQTISFEYIHSLSDPVLRPSREYIRKLDPIDVEADVVLRFGMLESSGRVIANRCVYDPQAEVRPEAFALNGSVAKHLAIVANEAEIRLLGNHADAEKAARALLSDICEVVVIKAGPLGALVVTAENTRQVPAFQTDFVWTLGTGDVFAAVFAAQWGVLGMEPAFAADIASRAVAEYVQTMNLPVPAMKELLINNRHEVTIVPGKVYIAAPFFNLQQRWLLEECVRILKAFGLDVFSPFHDIGLGGSDVAPLDITGLKSCDRVLALTDGLDSGTLFEIGYGTALGWPVYVFSQTSTDEALVMLSGTGARIAADFVTALHWTVWKL